MTESLSEVCPYRKVCEYTCPGDSEDGNWQPMVGFILREEGIFCVDWDVLIPQERLNQLSVLGTREDLGLDLGKKYPEYKRRAQKKYQQGEKYKATVARCEATGKPSIARQRYYYSEKGQESRQKKKDQEILFKGFTAWLKLPGNSGKTLTDYLNEVEGRKIDSIEVKIQDKEE